MTDDQVPPMQKLEDVNRELYDGLESGHLTYTQLHDALIADGYHRLPQNLSPGNVKADNWFGSGKPAPYTEILLVPGYRSDGQPDISRDNTRRVAVFYKS